MSSFARCYSRVAVFDTVIALTRWPHYFILCMPVVLSSASIRRRAQRKRNQSNQLNSGFSWVIFLIAICSFTVWSLGTALCNTQAEQSVVTNYFVSTGTYAREFASVLVLLQQLTAHLTQILPAFALYLLTSHWHYLSPSPFSIKQSIEGSHTAELEAKSFNPALRSAGLFILCESQEEPAAQ